MKESARVDGTFNKPHAIAVMGGHICVDTAQGGLAAALPFLIMYGGYSYSEVAFLILASNLASAVIQPLFGWLGDRAARPWIMAAGVFLAGAGMTGVGLMHEYPLIVVSALVSGVGVAMLHPEGGRLANLIGGASKNKSMSLFSLGGQLGFCLGPVVTVAAISAFGMAGMAVYAAFSIPYALLLLSMSPRFAAYGTATAQNRGGESAVSERWGAFAVVLGALSVRSIVYYGITGFVPLFMVAVFAQQEQAASTSITLFAGVGAAATLLSSRAAERAGTAKLMVTCFVALTVCMAVFAAGLSEWICLLAVVGSAVFLNLFNPPAITLGQGFVPGHLGMASGLSFGVAVCMGGVVSPMLGMVGDALGLPIVMMILAGFSAAGILLSAVVVRIAR